MTCRKTVRCAQKKKKTDNKDNLNDKMDKKSAKVNGKRYKCRFGFPRKPLPMTTILEPLDLDHYIKTSNGDVELSAEEFVERKKDMKKI